MKRKSVEFIPAKELKRLYSVFGHFYSVQLGRGRHVKCRSVLEITTKDAEPELPNRLSERKPDAVCIMMNPGKSQPAASDHKVMRLHSRDIGTLPIDLVAAKPDPTQYQLMRLMTYCEWDHVRVINLSDLRCPKSAEFLTLNETLRQGHPDFAHSIFAPERNCELAAKLNNSKHVALICAWGVHDGLADLISLCISCLPPKKVRHGLRKRATEDRYYHALRRSKNNALNLKWLTQMVKSLKAKK